MKTTDASKPASWWASQLHCSRWVLWGWALKTTFEDQDIKLAVSERLAPFSSISPERNQQPLPCHPHQFWEGNCFRASPGSRTLQRSLFKRQRSWFGFELLWWEKWGMLWAWGRVISEEDTGKAPSWTRQQSPSTGRGALEELPAQRILILNVVTTGSPWAGVNVSSTWILHCDSQIALAMHPGEGKQHQAPAQLLLTLQQWPSPELFNCFSLDVVKSSADNCK